MFQTDKTIYILDSKWQDEYRNLNKYAVIVGVCMQIRQLLPLKYFKAGLTF